LERYHQSDIALDPFPYNGMTTTCEALWMGVPVVTLIGNSGISRASYSLLANVGMADLAAASEDDYIRRATALAQDLPALAAFRADLRERMNRSPLTDASRLARNLEKAYREMWQSWCRNCPSESGDITSPAPIR
jgi:predicted O-linked N-acetylglucosamine transferase (SPINDLY family)